MPPSNFRVEDFDDKVRLVRQCDFVGEIALSELELRDLAYLVQQDMITTIPARGADERLLLAAVNCAYFYMDADGFWKPFCRLLGVEYGQAATGEMGSRIEAALLRLGHLDEPGYGANRYVTPVRMQAGLTIYDIPVFAGLLDVAHHQFGWGAFTTLPHARLIAFLDDEYPVETRFISFLKDPRSGGRLLRDVVRHLVLFRQGLIDTSGLNSLRGFRPGFWSELLKKLGNEAQLDRREVSGAQPPIFVFERNRGQCGLLFSRELVNRNTFRLDGEPVTESFNPIPLIEDFRDEFEVETRGGIYLRVPAWKPAENAAFALFKQSGEYLPHNSAVNIGAYILVAFNRSAPPESLSCDSDFEFCFTPGLRYWHVEVGSDTDLTALGYRGSGEQTPIQLAWVEGATILEGASDVSDVFLGCLPAVRISPTHLFHENRAALCWRIGDETSRIHVPGDGADTVVNLPFKGPCRGEIWIEPLGRERAENSVGVVRLSFCVLPECKITWPMDLYGDEDEPLVAFHASTPGIECDFPDCVRVQNAEASWTVRADADWIEGYVETDSLAVRVVRRIHRAGAEDADGRDLWLQRSELGCDDSVRIRGLPNTPVHLELEGGAMKVDVPLHQEFSEHGVAHVRCWDFHDRLASVDSPVFRICVHGNNGPVPTRGRVIDLPEMEQWLFGDERQPDADWIALLGSEGSAVLRSVMESLVAPNRVDLSSLSSKILPEFFTTWARSVFACACVFSTSRQATEYWREALDAVPPEQRKTLDWVLSAEVALGEGGNLAEVAEEFTRLNWEPPYVAWQSFLTALHARIRAEYDLIPLIVEWREEIEGRLVKGVPTEWSSTLARMPGGEQLSNACVQNLKSAACQHDPQRYQAALTLSYTSLASIETSCPPVVLSLALLLKELLLINFGGANEPPPPIPAHCHRMLRPLLLALLNRRSGAFQNADCNAASALPPYLLPLPERDQELLRAML